MCEELLSAKNIKDSNLDYHEDMTAELFETWFKTKLLPSLPTHSVIVMDNASYHSRQVTKIPNSQSSKADLQNFLHENNLYFHENYSKMELMEVLKCKVFDKQYYVDKFGRQFWTHRVETTTIPLCSKSNRTYLRRTLRKRFEKTTNLQE